MNRKEAETYSVHIWRSSDNRILRREWRNNNGDLHNPDGPAIEIWDEPTGRLHAVEYYENGARHRLEGPQCAVFDPITNRKVREIWQQNWEIHRDGDKPAVIVVDPKTGTIIQASYFKDGKQHRDQGPADISRTLEGVVREVWYQNGLFHREGGLPAIVEKDADGDILLQEYFENDEEIPAPSTSRQPRNQPTGP